MSRVLVPLATGCEELEAVTIIDLLRRAGLIVIVAGLEGVKPIKASRGVWLVPEVALDDVLHESFDLLVLPGGQPGTRNLKADARVLNLVQRMTQQGRFVAAICAAPSVLAEAGVLDGKRATCFPTCLDDYPKVVLQTAAIVEDGNLITSRGPGTAMDFALLLAERLAGRAARDQAEAGLVR